MSPFEIGQSVLQATCLPVGGPSRAPRDQPGQQ